MIWFFPILLHPSDAWAHRSGLSYAAVSSDHLSLTFAEAELIPRFPSLDDPALVAATLGALRISADGSPCTVGPPEIARVEGDGVALSSSLSCGPGTRTFSAPYLVNFETGHRQYLEADGQPVAVLDAGNDTVTFDGSSWAEVGTRFATLGVEHIWTGYDHLCFLLALLLAARNVRQMLTVVTGFTIAHSITLSLAATGVLVLPSAFVEPAIAASILYVGLENLWKPPPERRIVITFLLGLIHGFGFAGQLSELGLPGGALALALVSFNGGVEIGQACVVLLLLPILLKLRSWPAWDARVAPAVSIAVALMGLFWLLERLFFLLR